MSGPLSPLRSGYDHVDLPAAALGAEQPLSPIGHSRFGAVPLGHFGGVGLDLMPAILAPDDQPDAGGGSVAERQRGHNHLRESAPARSVRSWRTTEGSADRATVDDRRIAHHRLVALGYHGGGRAEE